MNSSCKVPASLVGNSLTKADYSLGIQVLDLGFSQELKVFDPDFQKASSSSSHDRGSTLPAPALSGRS